jgi:hypothetical protein
MRIVLSLILVLSLAACGKKKAPHAPTGGSQETNEAGSASEEEKNVNTPDDADDAKDMKSSDPEEGGE